MPELRDSRDEADEDEDADFKAAEAAADAWERKASTFVMGHREGREQGRKQGLLKGRLEALADVFERRGLVPTEAEQARITTADDPELVDRWRACASDVASVMEMLLQVEPKATIDGWMRATTSYAVGHREGRDLGLRMGLQETLFELLEQRGLIPTEAERDKITAAKDADGIGRWCERSNYVTTVAELFVD